MVLARPFSRSRARLRNALAAVAALTVLTASPAVAQNAQLTAEHTSPFTLGKAQTLNVKVGPVTVQTITVSDRGRVTTGGGLPGLSRSTPSEASSTLHVRLMAENPSVDEWAVTFVVEFLDRSGKVIDRVTKRSTWEGESKPYEFEHPMLQYAIPLIADVRIRFEAKLD
jgi:hypothetical protein